jgi:hypothetical protein
MVKQVPLVVSTAPERIWLQVADDSYSATEAFPDDHAEITWCQDSVIATEVKYVRADLHESLAERCERLEGALSDILAKHANDNHRPRAFYIAAEALSGSSGGKDER